MGAVGLRSSLQCCADYEGSAYAGVLRVIKRASVQPEPKLLQNPRASPETELVLDEPAHVAHARLGDSREVADDHYLMVTNANDTRASAVATSEPTTKNPLSKAGQSVTVSNRQEPSLEKHQPYPPLLREIRL